LTEFTTERLLLRQWRDEDLEPFASDALVAKIRSLMAERG